MEIASYVIVGILIGLSIGLLIKRSPSRHVVTREFNTKKDFNPFLPNEDYLKAKQQVTDMLYLNEYEQRTFEYKRSELRDERDCTRNVFKWRSKEVTPEGLRETEGDYAKYLIIWRMVMYREDPLTAEEFLIQSKNPELCISLCLRSPMLGIYNIDHSLSAKYHDTNVLKKEFKEKWGFE